MSTRLPVKVITGLIVIGLMGVPACVKKEAQVKGKSGYTIAELEKAVELDPTKAEKLVSIIAEEVHMYPPQEIAAKCQAYALQGKFEEVFSFYADWPGKDRMIEISKKVHERHQTLECRLGPIEIRENETFGEATRVVVPVLSVKQKDLSTGEVKIVPGRKILPMIFERKQTEEGERWYLIDPSDPNYARIESTWLNLSRKKVAGSPTIILKKEDNSVLKQIVLNGEVIIESIMRLQTEGER